MGRDMAAAVLSWSILSPPPTVVNLGFAAAPATPFLKRHPLYGYIRGLPYHHLPDAMLPRPRREDTVVIALLGGSVAYGGQSLPGARLGPLVCGE